MNKSKILIVDGMNLVKRCFHGIPKRYNNDKLETNVLYGFIRTLINEQSIFNFDGVFIVFDTPTSSQQKKEFYPEYKKNRKPITEEDLKNKEIINEQVKHLARILRTAKIPILAHKKFEADDIIASLAEQLKEKYKIYILSADKDLLQLIDKNVSIIRPRHTHSEKMVINLITFKELYPELNPNQIFDLKVLTGDSSDNITGLTRVGEKTAIKLLKQFNSVENIQKNQDQLEQKFKKILETQAEIIDRNKKLIKLDREIKIPEHKMDIIKPDFRTRELMNLYDYYNSNPWRD